MTYDLPTKEVCSEESLELPAVEDIPEKYWSVLLFFFFFKTTVVKYEKSEYICLTIRAIVLDYLIIT